MEEERERASARRLAVGDHYYVSSELGIRPMRAMIHQFCTIVAELAHLALCHMLMDRLGASATAMSELTEHA